MPPRLPIRLRLKGRTWKYASENRYLSFGVQASSTTSSNVRISRCTSVRVRGTGGDVEYSSADCNCIDDRAGGVRHTSNVVVKAFRNPKFSVGMIERDTRRSLESRDLLRWCRAPRREHIHCWNQFIDQQKIFLAVDRD